MNQTCHTRVVRRRDSDVVKSVLCTVEKMQSAAFAARGGALDLLALSVAFRSNSCH